MSVRICFVCLGNICRSPTAEATMRRLIEEERLSAQVEIDSAGTGAWHVGEPPDERAKEAGMRRGLALEGRARKVTAQDFADFDYVIAMDRSNRSDLHEMAPDEAAERKIELLRNFDPDSPRDAEVPDPYYGGDNGFERVLEICDRACRGLLQHIRDHHSL